MLRVVGDWTRTWRWTLVFWLFLIVATVIGLVVRIRPRPYSSREAMYIRLVGELWMNAVRAVALPLLVTSIACAVSDLRLRYSAQLGGFVILWALGTKFEVSLLAAALSYAARPGEHTGAGATTDVGSAEPPIRVSLGGCILDMLKDALPDNPVEACVRRKPELLTKPKFSATVPGQGDPYYYESTSIYIYQADVLGVVVGSVAVGMAMYLLAEDVPVLKRISESIRDTCQVILFWLLVIGGPFLALVVIGNLAGAHDMDAQLRAMTPYIWSVIVTFALQILVFYPVVYVLLAARWKFLKPFHLLWSLSETFVVAVSSQSAHVAFPFAHRALLKSHQSNPTVVNMVLGMMSAMNNDGTAVMVTAGALWARQRDLGITPSFYFSSMLLGVLGSVAAAGESAMHARMFVMAMTALGSPTKPEDVAPLLGIAWLMDSIASAVNIISSAFIAAIFGSLYEFSDNYAPIERREAEEEAPAEGEAPA